LIDSLIHSTSSVDPRSLHSFPTRRSSDLVDDKDNTVGGPVMQLPLEAVQEFNISTQRFSAANGRSEGAAVNVITKAGTNSYHVQDRKSTRLNSSHRTISYAVFCLKKKTKK